MPAQHGIASLQACPKPAHARAPQVPLVAPGGMLHTVPVQQSASPVHAPPLGWHCATHRNPSGSQAPEQHWPPAAQDEPFGTQATHFGPVPVSRQRLLQQSASPAQVASTGAQLPDGTPHRKPPAPSERQLLGAQQERSPAPLQAPPAGVHVETAVQWRTPLASGTQGAPPQHWSLNWQTLALVSWPGWAAGMQQAGSLGS